MLLTGIGMMGYKLVSSHNLLTASPLHRLSKLSYNYIPHICNDGIVN